MRYSKILIFLLVILLCCTAALAEKDSALTGLWNSGCDFLFHTENVSVTGEAVFSLEGERFKTAKLNYIQDGYSSFYGLTLLTPQPEGEDQETGWTIIADEEGSLYVMEAYEPGVYRVGSGHKENTLLRRSVRLDALTELGGLLIGQVEALLPAGTVTVTDENGLRTVHLAVSEEQLPPYAVSALNLAADCLSARWFHYGYDRSKPEDNSPSFNEYVTVTEALTDGTLRWTLRKADVDFSLDSKNRLTGAKGTVIAASTFWDQSLREVAVSFDLAMSDYGESRVKPFDPADYNVALAEEEKTVRPMETEPADFALCSSFARLHDYDPDTHMLEIELIAPEVFRRKDVESLAVGDCILTAGERLLVSSITQEYGYVIINKGEYEFSEGSVWLMEDADGNYRPVIYEDYIWTEVARIELPITERLLFLDMIVPESGELLDKPAVSGSEAFLQRLNNEDDPGFAANNTLVVFDQEGGLAIIERFYVPWQ